MAATASVSAPPRVALALVVAAYLLPLLVPVPLMEDDEGLHAAIAIEMVERGDWTVPRLLGQPFLDKPILYFWLQAASLRTLGASEFAVRLPGTLTALAGIAASGWLASMLFGIAVGRWAALCYATMLLPYAVSLSPLHDLVMVPLVALALGAFWRAHHATTAAAVARWTVLAGLVLGLSMLGKGLTGVGLIGVGMVAWMAWTRTWSLRLVAVGAGAVAIGALLAWPWYVAMEHASPGYLRYFIVDRHIGGVAGSEQRHAGRPLWYYLPVLLLGAWPWVVAAVSRSIRRADLAERLVWSWLIADFVLLTVAGSKLATYLLPAFPAVALLAARHIVATGPSVDGSRWIALSTSVLPLASLGAVDWWLGPGPSQARGPYDLLAPLAVVPLILTGFFLVTTAGRRWPSASRLAVVTACSLVVLSLLVRPLVARRLTAQPLAAQLNQVGAMPRTLLIVDEGVGSFLFYLRPELRRGLTAGRVQRISRVSLGDVRDPAGVFVAIAADRLAGVTDLYDLPLDDTTTSGSYYVLPWAQIRARQR